MTGFGCRGVIPGVTGVILAGGRSSRMGSDKALLPCREGLFIEAIYRCLAGLFDEVLVVTNTPRAYHFLPCRKVADRFAGGGPLAGLHAGLYHSGAPCIFAVACDMPFLDPELVRLLAGRVSGADLVLPESGSGLEPLHAFYGRSCLGIMAQQLAAGERRIASILSHLAVEIVERGEVASVDPLFHSFCNVNTPGEYYRFRKWESEGGDNRVPAPVPSSLRLDRRGSRVWAAGNATSLIGD